MKNAIPRTIGVLAAGVVLVFFGLHAAADTGQVIDARTGKPLADVYVVVRWDADAYAGVESRHRCFGVSATKTNAQGEFSLSSLSWNVNPFYSNRQRTQFFYREGYKLEGNTAQTQGNRILMSLDQRVGNERIAYIAEMRALAGCGNESEQKRELTNVFRAILEETVKLAKAPEEFRGLNNAIFDVETLEIGYTEALDRYAQRQKDQQVKKTISIDPPRVGGGSVESRPARRQ